MRISCERGKVEHRKRVPLWRHFFRSENAYFWRTWWHCCHKDYVSQRRRGGCDTCRGWSATRNTPPTSSGCERGAYSFMTSTRCSAANLHAFSLKPDLVTLAFRALQVGDSLHGKQPGRNPYDSNCGIAGRSLYTRVKRFPSEFSQRVNKSREVTSHWLAARSHDPT